MFQDSVNSEAMKMMAAMSAERAAQNLYKKVTRDGLFAAITRLLSPHRTQPLLELNKITEKIEVQGQEDVGLQTVDLGQVKGTMTGGRGQDFDCDFRPMQSHNRERWLGVAASWLSGRRLPPVALIQVGDCYFVKDGHHRISVARALGEQEIEAEVTRLATCGILPWQHHGASPQLLPQPRLEPSFA